MSNDYWSESTEDWWKKQLQAGDTALSGMNYPFPTVITQKDGESLVNVHYGVWPFDGAYWKNGSTVMNLFSNLDQQGVSVKQFKILNLLNMMLKIM